jgi:hypothetical protein
MNRRSVLTGLTVMPLGSFAVDSTTAADSLGSYVNEFDDGVSPPHPANNGNAEEGRGTEPISARAL